MERFIRRKQMSKVEKCCIIFGITLLLACIIYPFIFKDVKPDVKNALEKMVTTVFKSGLSSILIFIFASLFIVGFLAYWIVDTYMQVYKNLAPVYLVLCFLVLIFGAYYFYEIEEPPYGIISIEEIDTYLYIIFAFALVLIFTSIWSFVNYGVYSSKIRKLRDSYENSYFASMAINTMDISKLKEQGLTDEDIEEIKEEAINSDKNLEELIKEAENKKNDRNVEKVKIEEVIDSEGNASVANVEVKPLEEEKVLVQNATVPAPSEENKEETKEENTEAKIVEEKAEKKALKEQAKREKAEKKALALQEKQEKIEKAKAEKLAKKQEELAKKQAELAKKVEEAKAKEVENKVEEQPVQEEKVEEPVVEEVKEEVRVEQPIPEVKKEVIKPTVIKAKTDDDEEDDDDDDDDDDENEAIVEGFSKRVLLKLKTASPKTQLYYSEFRNLMRCYTDLKFKSCNTGDTYTHGNRVILKVTIFPKALKIYYALDPDTYDTKKYHHKDASVKKKYENIPLLMRVGSDRSYALALELVTALARKYKTKKTKVDKIDYMPEFITTSKDLLIANGGADLLRPSCTIETCNDISDTLANKCVMLALKKPVEGEKIVAEISIGELSVAFKSTYTIDLGLLKKVNLVPKTANYLKITASTNCYKAINVVADEFDPEVIKMMAITGGNIYRLVK